MGNSEIKPLRILIAEDEPDLRELVTFLLESEFSAQVTEAENGELAKKILESDPNFQIVVSDYNMPVMNGGQLLQFIRSTNYPAKFILVSAAFPGSIPEFKTVTPDAIAEKPSFSTKLKNAIKLIISENPPLLTINDYVRISINQLQKLGSINCHIFAKLSEDKFVKVINANESFGTDEYDRFQKKHISHLYIEKTNASALYNLMNDSYLKRTQDKNVTHEELIQIGDEINASIQELTSVFGFSEELEKLTKTGVDLAIKNMNADPSLKKLLAHLNLSNGNYLATHSSRLPYLANHIAKLMKWDSDSTSLKLAFASMLHDSTLDNPIHAKHKDETELEMGAIDLGRDHFEKFLNHPIQAAEIAKQFKGIPPDVDLIIAQHHEKCDGTGYPNKLNHTRIAPLASVFIVAHDLLTFYEKTGNSFKLDEFVSLNQSKYASGHFKKILNELAKSKFE